MLAPTTKLESMDFPRRRSIMDPRRRRYLMLIVVVIGLVSLAGTYTPHPSALSNALQQGLDSFLSLPALPPANGTLGFGAIVAVSRMTSPRRPGLLLAANITELEITIPAQPSWNDQDVVRLRANEGSTITRGSALAWLGHLNALRWFLSTSLETVLILEDDVDWDIHLRTSQVPKVAAGVRKLLAAEYDPQNLAHNPERAYLDPVHAGGYWSKSMNWDILYLGHCGDMFTPNVWSNATAVPRALFSDSTMPDHENMHSFTRKFLDSLSLPPQTRMVHRSVSPLCTFGFALTRQAAHRLLNDLAGREPDGGCLAYDVRVLEACRDRGLRCWTANPELFHHMDAASEIAIVNSDPKGKPQSAAATAVDELGRLQGAAPNIACGARSGSLWTEDPETLDYLREKVGRQGHCLRDQVAEDMSRWP